VQQSPEEGPARLPVGGGTWLSWVVLWTGAAAYAWLMGGSKPFTISADAETAGAFVLVLAVSTVAGRCRGLRVPSAAPALPQPAGSSPAQPAGSSPAQPAAQSSPRPSAPATEPDRFWVWLVVVGAVAAWELFCYFSGFGGHRHAYPTISSLQDLVSRFRVGRSTIVLAWFALGWRLTRR